MISFNFFWWIFPILILFSGKKDKIKAIILMIVLILILGLRTYNDIANDTHNYYTIFKYGISYIERNPMELLYSIIEISVIKANADFQWVLFIMAIVSVSSVYIACKTAKLNPYLGLLIYVLLTYYFSTFNGMRQLTADSILLIGYGILSRSDYTVKRKYISFILITIFASLFHKSAILALIIGIMCFFRFRLTYKQFIFISIISLFLGVHPLSKSIISSITEILNMYGVSDKYGFNDTISLSKIAMTGFYIYLFKRSNQESIWLQTIAIGIIIFNFTSFSPATIRIAYTFLICQTLFFAKIEISQDYLDQATELKHLCILYCIFLYYYFYSANISDMHHYIMNPISNLFI